MKGVTFMSIKNFVNTIKEACKEVYETSGYTGIRKVILYIIILVWLIFGFSIGFIRFIIQGIKTTLGKD